MVELVHVHSARQTSEVNRELVALPSGDRAACKLRRAGQTKRVEIVHCEERRLAECRVEKLLEFLFTNSSPGGLVYIP